MKTLLLLLALTLLPFTPQTEYGKPEELKGLTKVFVDTGGDIKNRERIAKEFKKLDLTLLDSAEGAEVVLEFGAGKSERLVGTMSGGQGSIHTKKMNTGQGRVYVMREGKARVVMSYEGEEKFAWEDKPASNFGKAFAKAWKKANGVK
jgi:hypothetical protein